MSPGKAGNCSDKCSNFDYCEEEGNTKRFIEGAICPDFHEEDEDEE